MAMEQHTQLSITFRRTPEGEWLVGGALGVPGLEHARACADFEVVDHDTASFAAGLCAGLARVPVDEIREFGALYGERPS